MEPESITSRPTPCPSCGAGLRADAPWCTLCYADLRPAPVRETVAVPASAPRVMLPTTSYGEPNDDPLTAPLATLLPSPPPVGQEPITASADPADGRTWPCSRCSADNPLGLDTCSGCGAGFLSAVRDSDPPLLRLPLVGDITKLPRSQRLLLAGGLLATVLVPLAAVTLLLTHRPPDAAPTVPAPATSRVVEAPASP